MVVCGDGVWWWCVVVCGGVWWCVVVVVCGGVMVAVVVVNIEEKNAKQLLQASTFSIHWHFL